jgi:Tfp pilus assembly protein PilV
MRSLQSGLSYVEVLVATLLITVALVPMIEALAPGVQGSALYRQQAESHYALTGKLETVLAEPFADLDAAATAAGAYTAPTSYSDLAAVVPHQVFIWRYDADDADADGNVFTGGEDDLLWVQVQSQNGNQALETLLSQY